MASVRKITNEYWPKLSKVSLSPLLDTELLLAKSIGKDRNFLYSHPEFKITKTAKNKFTKFFTRRFKGEPIAYIVGKKEFFGLDFIVNKDVLIPRPDTEILVEEVLNFFEGENTYSRLQKNVLDMGTGCGCIAVTLKKYLPKIDIIATDVSKKAIIVAKKNANRIAKNQNKTKNTKIEFYVSDLFKKVPEKYKSRLDVIVFNPPYLTKNEANKANLKFEPPVALTPKSFSKFMNNFFTQSIEYVNKNSTFFLEIGHKQASIIKKIALIHYPKAKIKVIKDLGGFDRVVKIKNYSGV